MLNDTKYQYSGISKLGHEENHAGGQKQGSSDGNLLAKLTTSV